MDLQEAREIVCRAGLELVKEGLVARTWGNISCRVDEHSFVITPSGRNYEDLKPDDIVQVAIEDLSWSGPVKPSSEKGLHAEVYKLSAEGGAVIHTHQPSASVAAAARREVSVVDEELAAVLGTRIPCAAYGLPGTKKLKAATAEALKTSGARAALMANHGAVCFGKTMNEAFQVASALERACEGYIAREVLKATGEGAYSDELLYSSWLKRKKR